MHLSVSNIQQNRESLQMIQPDNSYQRYITMKLIVVKNHLQDNNSQHRIDQLQQLILLFNNNSPQYIVYKMMHQLTKLRLKMYQ